MRVKLSQEEINLDAILRWNEGENSLHIWPVLKNTDPTQLHQSFSSSVLARSEKIISYLGSTYPVAPDQRFRDTIITLEVYSPEQEKGLFQNTYFFHSEILMSDGNKENTLYVPSGVIKKETNQHLSWHLDRNESDLYQPPNPFFPGCSVCAAISKAQRQNIDFSVKIAQYLKNKPPSDTIFFRVTLMTKEMMQSEDEDLFETLRRKFFAFFK